MCHLEPSKVSNENQVSQVSHQTIYIASNQMKSKTYYQVNYIIENLVKYLVSYRVDQMNHPVKKLSEVPTSEPNIG